MLLFSWEISAVQDVQIAMSAMQDFIIGFVLPVKCESIQIFLVQSKIRELLYDQVNSGYSKRITFFKIYLLEIIY